MAEECRVKKIASETSPIRIKPAKASAISVLFINCAGNVNKIGEYIINELGIDISVVYEIIDGECIVNLRSKKFNVGMLATLLCGCGNSDAASFTLDDTPNEMESVVCAMIYRNHELLKRE